jgi:sensor domain CHASE-containing protein
MTPKQKRLINLHHHIRKDMRKKKIKKYVLLFLLIAGLLKLTSVVIGNL